MGFLHATTAYLSTHPAVILAEGASQDSASTLSWVILGVTGVALALALYCVFTIHKNPHFNELQKVGWLVLCLGLPIFGPLAWLTRARLEHKAQADPARRRTPETVTEFAERLVPVPEAEFPGGAGSGDTRSPARSRPTTMPVQPQKSVEFTESRPVATNPATEDTAENPFIQPGENGTRTLKF